GFLRSINIIYFCSIKSPTNVDDYSCCQIKGCAFDSFSPSWCGRRVLREANPALMLCMRRLSLLLAISRLMRFSCSIADFGDTGRPPNLSCIELICPSLVVSLDEHTSN
ncbi:unnamed protein product, partial [Meganyctiphanes norvegica]